MSLFDQTTATFRPVRADDLRPKAPPVGFRTVWESQGFVDDGPYAGQEMWLCETYPRWVPDCDLVDRVATDNAVATNNA